MLFLSAWYPYPPDNGSKLRVYHLLRFLAMRHGITLLSFVFGTAQSEEVSPLEIWCESVNTVKLDPFDVNRAGSIETFLSPRPMASRPIPEMRRLVSNALNHNCFDVVIASTGMMAGYALQAPVDCVKVLEEHNSMSRWMHERYLKASSPLDRLRCWASWQKMRRYEAKLFSCFDLVTMVSEQDQRVTKSLIGQRKPKVTIVPNGVDTKVNMPGLARCKPNSLVFNGSLTYSVNYDAIQYFLSEIYPKIKMVVNDVTLTITGSTADVALKALRLDESVKLTGYVNDVRIPVSEAAVCVVPIQEGGGTRLKILEAMALGTAVISTSKGAEGLDLIAGEHLLIADGPELFAKNIINLLHDSNQRHQLEVAAREKVERQYDWEMIGGLFVDHIEDVIRTA